MLLDIVVEFLFQTFVEGVLSLAEGFLPRKLRSGKLWAIVVITALLLAAAMFMGGVCGIVMLIENQGQSLPGWGLVGLAAAYILCGVLLKVFRTSKKA